MKNNSEMAVVAGSVIKVLGQTDDPCLVTKIDPEGRVHFWNLVTNHKGWFAIAEASQYVKSIL